jgi:hypothetical protein
VAERRAGCPLPKPAAQHVPLGARRGGSAQRGETGGVDRVVTGGAVSGSEDDVPVADGAAVRVHGDHRC